jgi:hypothetical protein
VNLTSAVPVHANSTYSPRLSPRFGIYHRTRIEFWPRAPTAVWMSHPSSTTRDIHFGVFVLYIVESHPCKDFDRKVFQPREKVFSQAMNRTLHACLVRQWNCVIQFPDAENDIVHRGIKARAEWYNGSRQQCLSRVPTMFSKYLSTALISLATLRSVHSQNRRLPSQSSHTHLQQVLQRRSEERRAQAGSQCKMRRAVSGSPSWKIFCPTCSTTNAVTMCAAVFDVSYVSLTVRLQGARGIATSFPRRNRILPLERRRRRGRVDHRLQ